MIRSLSAEHDPDTSNTEYLRGKLQERSSQYGIPHSAGAFNEGGYQRWAARSGRSYIEDEDPAIGAQSDYSSPVVGNGFAGSEAGRPNVGAGMGNLSRLTGGRKGKASPDYSTLNLLKAAQARGGCHDSESACEGKGKPKSARGQMISKLMKQHGVSLGQASRMLKEMGH